MCPGEPALTNCQGDSCQLLLWLNRLDVEKEEAQEVQRDERGEGRVAGSAGDASAGKARGEH